MTQSAHFQVFQASAGAGKTYTIVKEYLKLCLQSEAQTDNFRHILAITFTNAAANEMKAKIVGQLRDIIDSDDTAQTSMGTDLMKELGIASDQLKNNARRLMTRIIHDYSSFCVSTIDAFVQRLSRTFAHDLGLPGQYAVSVDDEEVAQAVTENIGQQISSDNPFLTRLLADFYENAFNNQRSTDAKRNLTEFVAKLLKEKAYQKDESNLVMDEQGYNEAATFIEDKTIGFERQMHTMAARILGLTKENGLSSEDLAYGKNGFISFVNKVEKGKYEPVSQRFAALADGNAKWYSTAAAKRIPDAELERIGHELVTAAAELKAAYEKGVGAYLFYDGQRNLLYLYALRAQIKHELELLANEEEVVHISEFNKLLQRVLGDFTVPFVYERLGELFRHLFVDEFQDTSVMQWHNLLPLVDNALSTGGTAMVVGDGKQSIYRFRSGEVGQIVDLPMIYGLPNDEREAVFSQYQRNLVDNFGFHDLGTNYRSFSNVIAFNNDFFTNAVESLSETSRKVYADTNEAFGKVVSITQKANKKEEGCVEVELYDAENQRDYPVGRVREIIVDLTENHGYGYGDITVLTRKKEFGSAIANHLNDNGIPVVLQVSVLLSASDKVQLLVSTMQYLINRGDEVAVAQVLYFSECSHNTAFQGDVTCLFDKVKAVAAGELAMESALGLADDAALAKAMAKATNLYDLCLALLRIYGLDSIRDAFVNYFLDEVFKWQSSTLAGMADFLVYWEQKRNQLAVKSVNDNAVNIMTIHKSKGLEFKVVIYPDAITDLDEKSKKSDEIWVDQSEFGFEPIPHLGKVLFRLENKAEMMGEAASRMLHDEAESNRLDNLNLLYVAFTRAVQRLYVIAPQSKPDKPNLLRDFLMKHTINEVSGNDACVLYRFGDNGFNNPAAGDEGTHGMTDATDSVSADWFQKISIDAQPSMFWVSPDDPIQPSEWGELVHQILSGIHSPTDIATALKPYLLEGTISMEQAEMLEDRFDQIANLPEIAAAFTEDAKVKNECDILSNGEILRPDRYAELPDVIYLLEYKTGKKDKAHHEQLKRYVGALQGMVEKEIRAFLVYLSDPIEVEKVMMDSLF